MLVVSWFVCGIAYFLFHCYIFKNKIYNEKFETNIKVMISSLGISIIWIVLNKIDLLYLRPYIVYLYIFIMIKILYKKPIVKTILGLIGIFCIMTLSEVMVGVSMMLLNVNLESASSVFFGHFIINTIILLIANEFFKLKIVNSIIKHIFDWYSENEYKSLVLFSVFCIIVLTYIVYNNFISILPPSFLILTNLFFIGIFMFIVGFFNEKSNNHKLKDDYQKLMEYTKTYEELLDEKNKNQHEYKNQLVLISDMNSVKKVREYINKLIDTEDENIEYDWINKIKYLPTGGIKGLIYYKIKTMLKKKITPCVDISKEIDNKKIWKTCNDNLKDISMILGVFIDNAIEAAIECDKKSVIIEAYLEGKEIVYSISNTYKEINIKKIDKEGYTTKGKGHGYGLPVVKDIISKNESLRIAREINGDYYISKLYIKK